MDKLSVLCNLERVKKRAARHGASFRYSIEGQDCTPQVNSLIVAGRICRIEGGTLQVSLPFKRDR